MRIRVFYVFFPLFFIMRVGICFFFIFYFIFFFIVYALRISGLGCLIRYNSKGGAFSQAIDSLVLGRKTLL